MKKSKKRTRKNEGLAKSPLATLEIRSKGLTDSETGLMMSALDRVLRKIRNKRKKLGFSALSYLIDLK